MATTSLSNNIDHVPVLLAEVLSGLSIKPDGVYLDVTGGSGGHSAAILAQLGSAGSLWIGDYDARAVERLRKRFAADQRVKVLRERFSEILNREELPQKFNGILADFGVSSPQLEDDSIGIGFSVTEAPLDMRLDDRLERTAADILAEASEQELADIFYHFGGETAARRLARAIVHDRGEEIFLQTAGDLRGLCERVLGKFYRGKRIHAATKAFQGLRIAVNQELDEVSTFVKAAPGRLASDGRLVTIAFHEGEDRLVKTAFKELSGFGDFMMITKKPVVAGDEELALNPRARSAKLRILSRRSE